jgi:hypothetical protein
MLRRPSELPAIRREEGCSSTAFEATENSVNGVWSNHADRGSPLTEFSVASAEP